MAYIKLSDDIQNLIYEDRAVHRVNPWAFKDEDVIRRDSCKDKANIMRPAFVRDVEKIMNIPYFTRYSDKTQVFSMQKNDDISRRMYHVQLVSRIARNIGRALNLNLDLIEAISLGHDLGHTPFGHAGEKILNEIYNKRCGRYFNHNVQSARILDTIFPVNVSLQTLDGIICHNGEIELREYRPEPVTGFESFDEKMKLSLNDANGVKKLVPGTLEGCVMRISDIIAYLGKDRQDAIRLGFIPNDDLFSDLSIGRFNAEIINNMTVNLVEQSYGKPYLLMDDEYFEALSRAKKENYDLIYHAGAADENFVKQLEYMFEKIYERLYDDLVNDRRDGVIFTHHIDYIGAYTSYYKDKEEYLSEDADDIVADAIASMTDDYFIELFKYLFPEEICKLEYTGYFG